VGVCATSSFKVPRASPEGRSLTAAQARAAAVVRPVCADQCPLSILVRARLAGPGQGHREKSSVIRLRRGRRAPPGQGPHHQRPKARRDVPALAKGLPKTDSGRRPKRAGPSSTFVRRPLLATGKWRWPQTAAHLEGQCPASASVIVMAPTCQTGSRAICCSSPPSRCSSSERP
jgi:hypothetical protein